MRARDGRRRSSRSRAARRQRPPSTAASGSASGPTADPATGRRTAFWRARPKPTGDGPRRRRRSRTASASAMRRPVAEVDACGRGRSSRARARPARRLGRLAREPAVRRRADRRVARRGRGRPQRAHPGPDVERQGARVVGGERRPRGRPRRTPPRAAGRPMPWPSAVRIDEQVGQGPPRPVSTSPPKPDDRAARIGDERASRARAGAGGTARRRRRSRPGRRCRGRRGSPGSRRCRRRRGADGRRRATLRRPVATGRPARTAPNRAIVSSEPVVGQGVGRDPVAAGHRLGGDEGVDDRLLGRLDRRVEQRVDREVVRPIRTSTAEAADRRANEVRGSARLPVAKPRNRSPLECPPVPPIRAMPETRPLGEPLALVGQERRVGRDDDDDRAEPAAARRAVGDGPRRPRAYGLGISRRRDRLADRDAVDAQPVAPAVVGLDEDADRPAAATPRRRPATPSRSRP